MEYKKAKRPYTWLWFSPLLTLPTLFIILLFQELNYSYFNRQTSYLGIGVSALWHLILLSWVLNKRNAFVRWHGRQALVLAILRTAIPLFFVTFFIYPENALGPSFWLNLLVWFIGTLIGQKQAKRGDCSLARWFKHEDDLPGPPDRVEVSTNLTAADWNTEELLHIIRFSQDENERQAAVETLNNMGLVEDL